MIEIFTFVVSLFVASADVERLRASAPTYLDEPSARAHLAAARVAAWIANEDEAVILAIAWHESNYIADKVQPEPGNRVSCGVMTPVPHVAPCTPFELSMFGGYLIGALHLHEWRGIVGGHALLGYAGLAGACAKGPYLVKRKGRDVDLCGFESEMLGRASTIRRSPGA